MIADVRGYTSFTQDHGDEAAAELAARFAQLAREGVENRGGTLLELRGDEALAVFSSARQAIRAAVELQIKFVESTLADPSIPLRVGIGLDAGEAVPVEGGYRGGALNLAARLCSKAGGGQILASREAVHLARRIDGVRFVDGGQMQMKGMTEPVHVVRVLPEGEDPAAQLADAVPSAPAGVRSYLRAHRPVAILLAVTIVAVIAAPVALLVGRGPAAVVTANSVASIDPGSGKVADQIPLGFRPGQIATGGGALWITDPQDDLVARVDTGTHAVQRVQVGSQPDGVAVGAGAVWVANSGDGTVARISLSTDTVVQTVAVGNGPVGVAAGTDGVWVANSLDNTVSRIDPSSGKVTAIIPVGGSPSRIALGFDSVWVSDSSDASLSQIDPRSDVNERSVSVGNQPVAVTVGEGAVWVANTLDGTVSQVNPQNGSVTRVFSVGSGPAGIAIDNGSVWVAAEFRGTLSRISPGAQTSVERFNLGNGPAGAAPAGEALWVIVRGGTSHRGGTLTIAGTDDSTPKSADPALGFDSTAFPIFPYVYDGLVGLQRVGGVGGSTLVPDLATALPTPTDSGKTYTFTLRPDIRFSNGAPVTAEDVASSVERAFTVDPFTASQNFPSVLGTEACTKQGKPCDLSKGIEADVASRTVTFHLSQADPDFLYKLAGPGTAVVPATTPDHDMQSQPIAGTGPYDIRSLEPGKRMLLARNPNFHEWSPAAQPSGFPDQIIWESEGTANDALDAVQSGSADYFGTTDEVPPDRLPQLLTNFTSQVHPYSFPGPFVVFLNTRVPPFDNPDVRRALSYAIDRQAVADHYPGRSRITCQVLPSNFPGYRPYCPYTVAPSEGGSWTAPDLAKARRLVEKSGTKGTDVTVWASEHFAPPSEAVVSALNELGYHAQLRTVGGTDFGKFYAYVTDPRNDVQATDFWVTVSPPSASALVSGLGLSCDSFDPKASQTTNVSEFCDRSIDAMVHKALATQATDRAAAGVLWTQVDRALVVASPIIPLLVPEGIDFVSKRVGNYQENPGLGALLDQIWVR